MQFDCYVVKRETNLTTIVTRCSTRRMRVIGKKVMTCKKITIVLTCAFDSQTRDDLHVLYDCFQPTILYIWCIYFCTERMTNCRSYYSSALSSNGEEQLGVPVHFSHKKLELL